MGLDTNDTIVQGDFIQSTDADATPANDNNKVPKLETVDSFPRRIAKLFLPDDTVYTDDIPTSLDRLDGVGKQGSYQYTNDTLKLDSALWTAYVSHVITTFGEEYGLVTAASEAGSVQQVGLYETLTFASDLFIEMGVQLTGTTGDEPPAWGVGNSNSALSNGISRDAGPEGSGNKGFGFREDAGALKVRVVNGASHTESTITGITLTDTNKYRIEFEAGVEVRFYVNGTLEATITTNLPSTGDVYIGYGYRGTTGGHGMRISAPRVSY